MQNAAAKKFPLSDEELDTVFHALANTSRRKLLARLAEGPAMITELAKPFEMSLPAVSKHLGVLEKARLVERKVDGRIHQCTLQTGPLLEAGKWLQHYRTYWEETLEALAEFVEKENNRENKTSDKKAQNNDTNQEN